jgi:hypothetical protein
MEDKLKQYKSDFDGVLYSSERQFCDIHFAFPSSTSLDGVDFVSAHRIIMIAASPYLRNKIELMTELSSSVAIEGSSLEKPWLLSGINKEAFEIVVDFMYHPRDLSVTNADKELGGTISPAIAHAVFKAAHLLLMPVVQAMMFKVVAAQLTPANCLGALQLCLQSKEQWTQLAGQGEALSESARQTFALKAVEATEIALKVASGQGDAYGDIDVTLSYSLANCDLNFFETLIGNPSSIKNSVACNSLFSLLLAWYRLSNPGATAANLLSWLSLLVAGQTFTWSANAEKFSLLQSKTQLCSPVFEIYGQKFHLQLVKDDRGTTNAGLYLKAMTAMPGRSLGYTLTIKATDSLRAASFTSSTDVFSEAGCSRGCKKICTTAKLLLHSSSEIPTYVTANGTIEIIIVPSTSLVRLGVAYLTDNFESLTKEELFCTISSSMIKEALPFNELRVSSELILLQALLKWNDSKDKISDDMLKSVRLSQISFDALVPETQGHACLQKSDRCKKHIETIVKNALSGKRQSSWLTLAEKPRLYAKAGSLGDVGCAEIVTFMMKPSQLRESKEREKELRSMLMQTEHLLNDSCNSCQVCPKKRNCSVRSIVSSRHARTIYCGERGCVQGVACRLVGTMGSARERRS